MKETWKPVFGNTYAVSNLGRVKRVEWHRALRGDGVLRPSVTRRGYKMVTLSVGGKLYYRTIHALVAQAFRGSPGSRQVNRKNGVKQDNRPSNLEYVTQAANNSHARRTGLWKPHPRKLSAAQRARIRAAYKPGKPWREGNKMVLARRFGVSKSTMDRVVA